MVIPHHHNRGLLVHALQSVVGVPGIVVDDSVEGGLRGASLPGAPRVVRTAGSTGFARAANAGLMAAEAQGYDRALLLNDDAQLLPGCLAALVDAWGPGVGTVAPVLEDAAGRVSSTGLELRWWGRMVERRDRSTGPPRPVMAVSGAAMLLGTGQRFDVGFSHAMEDVELCRRLRGQGLSVILVPAARCRHIGGASVGRRTRAAQRHAVSGHLRLVGGGWRSGVVLALAAAQVVREGGPLDRLGGIRDGWRDHRRT